MNNEYIIDINFNNDLVSKDEIIKIEDKINDNINLSNEEINKLLNYIIDKTNKKLSKDKNDPYINKCDTAQAIIGYALESIGIQVYVLETQKVIYKDVKGHSFLVAKFNDDLYLIDNTYRQFFLKENCLENRKATINGKIVLSPDPGYYIAQDNDRANTIKPLLENGFIKLDDNIAKIYCDSFLATRTNVYEAVNIPNIPGSIYINSLLKNTSDYSKKYDELEDKIDIRKK